jgi:hypothetical protein
VEEASESLKAGRDMKNKINEVRKKVTVEATVFSRATRKCLCCTVLWAVKVYCCLEFDEHTLMKMRDKPRVTKTSKIEF